MRVCVFLMCLCVVLCVFNSFVLCVCVNVCVCVFACVLWFYVCVCKFVLDVGVFVCVCLCFMCVCVGVLVCVRASGRQEGIHPSAAALADWLRPAEWCLRSQRTCEEQ